MRHKRDVTLILAICVDALILHSLSRLETHKPFAFVSSGSQRITTLGARQVASVTTLKLISAQSSFPLIMGMFILISVASAPVKRQMLWNKL